MDPQVANSSFNQTSAPFPYTYARHVWREVYKYDTIESFAFLERASPFDMEDFVPGRIHA